MTDLERIARELCMSAGYDPDIAVFRHILAQGTHGHAVAPLEPAVPQWAFYTEYVRGTLSMVITGAQDGDLRTIIEDILAEQDVPVAAEAMVEPEPDLELPAWKQIRGFI